MQCISPEVTVKDFKKCFISSAVQETGDMFWNNSEEEGDVSECEVDKGIDCEKRERERDCSVKADRLTCIVS